MPQPPQPPSFSNSLSSNSPYINQGIYDTNSLYNQGDQQTIFTDFKLRNRYERDYHRYMMGISSPDGFNNQSAAFVQLAAPTLLWIADWTGARFLYKPVVPNPYTVGNNWTLLDVMMEPAEIVLSQDGTTPLYRLTGTYVFGASSPGTYFFDNVAFPTVPWFTNDGIATLRTITINDLDEANMLLPFQQIARPSKPPPDPGPPIGKL